MALLYDAHGRELYAGGVCVDDVRDAIQAAALAGDWRLAAEIADRYDLYGVCLRCAIKSATTVFYDLDGNSWRMCGTCEEELSHRVEFRDVKVYLDGLIKRPVA